MKASIILFQMINETPQFKSIEATLQSLQKSHRNLTTILTDTYTTPHIPQTLQCQIDAIFKQEYELEENVDMITRQIRGRRFVPAILDQWQIEELGGYGSVPEWFRYVLQKEYEKLRGEFDQYAIKMLDMHDMEMKTRKLKEERENIQHLVNRYSFKPQSNNEIEITEELKLLIARINHVKKSFRYFCEQITSKIKIFVEQIKNKSISFNSKKENYIKKEREEDYGKNWWDHQEYGMKSGFQEKEMKNVMNMGGRLQNFGSQYGDCRNRIERRQEKLEWKQMRPNWQVLSDRAFERSNNKSKPITTRNHIQNDNSYISKARNFLIPNPPQIQKQTYNPYFQTFNSPPKAQRCMNHHNSPTTLTHTCSKNSNIRESKSIEDFHIHNHQSKHIQHRHHCQNHFKNFVSPSSSNRYRAFLSPSNR